MDGNSFRQESHIAQQSRREKLRIVEQTSTTSSLLDNNNNNNNNNNHHHHHHHVFTNHYEQMPSSSVHSGLIPDLVAVRNIRNGDLLHRYGPNSSVFNSEMLNFAANNNVLGDEKNAILDQELGLVQQNRGLFFTNCMSNPSVKASNSCSSSNWRTIDSQHSYEWMVNDASGLSVGRESNNNQKAVFVGDVLSNNPARVNNLSRNVGGYDQDCNLSTYVPSQDCPKQHQQQQFTSHLHYYQNNATIQDVLASQPSALFLENANSWSNGGGGDQLGLIPRKSEQEGLSLTLSSNPPPDRANINQFGEGYVSNNNNQDSRSFLCPMSKPEIISRGKSINDSSNYALQNVGPLGPFTGYATILKSSRFLKPAQQLLEEFCAMTGSNKQITTSGEVGILGCVDVGNAAENRQTSPHKINQNKSNNNNNDSVVSSSTFYSSSNEYGDVGIASSSCESYKPEYQQKKAKLLYLQEEVYRRYKQYHQQMQMVSSSFESVAGLSSATPYVCLALRSVSRNFKCIKQAIADQLGHITKALGEDLVSPNNTGASSSKGDNTMTSRLRYIDQSFQRHKTSGANVGYYEPQQHVWRPQRGLPERSVAILRAWLFEHFLHPYPTDADKHMLAAQTGLSRNQVSNWFINARVRVWKPMVEEMHTLETKGVVVEGNHDVEEKCGREGSSSRGEQPFATNCGEGSSVKVEPWNQEKRSRVEFQVPMNFLPYQTSGIEVGGMGAVSLTLGLRHGVENAQHHHQHQNQLRGQFGGQIIHDFVG